MDKEIDVGELEREVNEEYKKIKDAERQERIDAFIEVNAFSTMIFLLLGPKPGYRVVKEMYRSGMSIDKIESTFRPLRDECIAAFNRINMAIRAIKEGERKKSEGGDM